MLSLIGQAIFYKQVGQTKWQFQDVKFSPLHRKFTLCRLITSALNIQVQNQETSMRLNKQYAFLSQLQLLTPCIWYIQDPRPKDRGHEDPRSPSLEDCVVLQTQLYRQSVSSYQCYVFCANNNADSDSQQQSLKFELRTLAQVAFCRNSYVEHG